MESLELVELCISSGVVEVDIFTVPVGFHRFDYLTSTTGNEMTLLGGPAFLQIRQTAAISPTTRLEENMSRIQSWPSLCKQKHESCN